MKKATSWLIPDAPDFRKYFRWFWYLVTLVFVFIPVLLFAISKGLFGKLPTFEELENPKSSLASEIYTSDGVLLGKYYSENRSVISADRIPPHVFDALIATEDVRFEKHSGIDLKGLVRAVLGVLTGNSSGGGSTLTQQTAKNLFHKKPHSTFGRIQQKLKEWIIAGRLEREYTKDELIVMYLNTVEFSDNNFGIKSAANAFFNVEPDSLSIEQAAVLIGMLKAPGTYNPRTKPENSLSRRNVVMHQMVKYGFLDEAVYDSLKELPVVLNYQRSSHIAGLATYFRENLRLSLKDILATDAKQKTVEGEPVPYDLYKDGLKIYVTIDSRIQKYAEEAVAEHLTALQNDFFKTWKDYKQSGKHAYPWEVGDRKDPELINKMMKRTPRYKALAEAGASQDSILKVFNTPVKMTVFSWKTETRDLDTTMTPMDSIRYHKMFLHTGFMVLEPSTGYVLAWVGGINQKHFQLDHVNVKTKRQVGSTFKPFVYAAAIERGYSPCMKVSNTPYTIEKGRWNLLKSWTPHNSSDAFEGQMVSLYTGLAYSINCISAFLIDQIGPYAVDSLAQRMGITSHLDPVPSICLGTSDISVAEMTGAYTAFVNNGDYAKPVMITRIEDSHGNEIYSSAVDKREALNPETAWVMIKMLRNVINKGTGQRLRYKYKINADIIGKTGTTQNHSDGWFMAATPDLVMGCWVGADDPSVHFRQISYGQGASMALPITGLFLQKVYADKKLGISASAIFPEPEDLAHFIETDCSKYSEIKGIQYEEDPVWENAIE